MVTLHKRSAGPSVPRLTLRWFSHTSDQLLLLLSYRIPALTHAGRSCLTCNFSSVQFGKIERRRAGKVFRNSLVKSHFSRIVILLCLSSYTQSLSPGRVFVICHYMLSLISSIRLNETLQMNVRPKQVSFENKTPDV